MQQPDLLHDFMGGLNPAKTRKDEREKSANRKRRAINGSENLLDELFPPPSLFSAHFGDPRRPALLVGGIFSAIRALPLLIRSEYKSALLASEWGWISFHREGQR
jgi:hypothetical protein